MDGRVTPAGLLVRPLAGPRAAQRPGQHGTGRTAPRGITQRLARPARLSRCPAVPGGGRRPALLLAALRPPRHRLAVRRRRRAGSRSGP